jgi:hypothetical protein
MSDPTVLLERPPRVVTAGVELFERTLHEQGVDVVTVDWRPPLDGLAAELARVALDRRTSEANRYALERITAAEPRWVGVLPARILGLYHGRAALRMDRQIRRWDFSNYETAGTVNVLMYCRLSGAVQSMREKMLARIRRITRPSCSSGGTTCGTV